MGVPWAEQELGCSMLDVLDEVRKSIREGDFRLKTWDHNSPEYVPGRSNKQLRIVGAGLLGRPDCTHDEATAAIIEAILGREIYVAYLPG